MTSLKQTILGSEAGKRRLPFKFAFTGQVSTLVVGTALSQLCTLAIYPLLTRTFSPELYGQFALFLSIATFFCVIATGRYEMAVVLAESDEDALSILILSCGVALALSAGILGIGYLAWPWIQTLSEKKIEPSWLYLLPTQVLVSGVFQTTGNLLNRMQSYRLIAICRIITALATGGISLALGRIHNDAAALILGALYALILVTLVQVVFVIRKLPRRPGAFSEIVARIRPNIIKYRSFPLVNTPHVLVDTLQSTFVPLIIGANFGVAVLGNYSFAMRLARAPLSLIGSATAQVFFEKASKARVRGESMYPMARRICLGLSLVAAPLFLIVALFAPQLTRMIFGEKWSEAGQYIRILSPWLFFSFIFSPISHVPMILNHQRTAFFLGILTNFAIVLPFALGSVLGLGINQVLYVTSALPSLLLIVYGRWLLQIARQEGNRTGI